MSRYEIRSGDCLDVLRGMADNSVDAIVTDPPYGLSFMGKRWDYDVPSEVIWAECLRVLKPGGYLLAFAGTRTQHRMAVRIEDAGFEIRDMIAWVYGSGFPKSLDVSKAIDKAAGAERELLRTEVRYNEASGIVAAGRNERTLIERKITAPATVAARQWQGWGTALKPALEPITVARKPLIGTVADNVQQYGTGALNIDDCRVEAERPTGWGGGGSALYEGGLSRDGGAARPVDGRWPANLIHDGSAEAAEVFGEAARFFYCAKASKTDRNEGCDNLPLQAAGGMSGRRDGSMGSITYNNNNTHPTVKPADLMAYLCRLVTPPGGVVLDPFMGSGSTGKAAMLEGFRFIGIEREAEYVAIARARIEAAAPEPEQDAMPAPSARAVQRDLFEVAA